MKRSHKICSCQQILKPEQGRELITCAGCVPRTTPHPVQSPKSVADEHRSSNAVRYGRHEWCVERTLLTDIPARAHNGDAAWGLGCDCGRDAAEMQTRGRAGARADHDQRDVAHIECSSTSATIRRPWAVAEKRGPSSLFSPLPAVEEHGREQDEAAGDVLVEGRHVEEVHRVLDDAHDEHAGDDEGHAADAAGERHSP